MDVTALGIFFGLVACVGYTLIRLVRQRSFELGDIGTIMLCFLAGFSVPVGVKLIAASVSGAPASLPNSWREYVAVAGVAAIGLAIQYLTQVCRAAWSKPASLKAASQNDSGQSPGPDAG